MSRGPGSWQRSLLQVTDGGLLATTRSVLLDRAPRPTRSDVVCVIRATRALAEKGAPAGALRPCMQGLRYGPPQRVSSLLHPHPPDAVRRPGNHGGPLSRPPARPPGARMDNG